MRIGEPVIPSQITNSIEEGIEAANSIGYPVVLRPAFTLGGTGGGFADNEDALLSLAETVGFEPTWSFPQTDFESAPL